MSHSADLQHSLAASGARLVHTMRQLRRCPDCPHAWKKHRWSGRCRPNCKCTNGLARAKR